MERVCVCVCVGVCLEERPLLEEGLGVKLYGDKNNYSWATFQGAWNSFAYREDNSR